MTQRAFMDPRLVELRAAMRAACDVISQARGAGSRAVKAEARAFYQHAAADHRWLEAAIVRGEA